MNSFKKDAQVLIATDIASRGIDVKNIQTVINYASPKNI
jgi:superfamily II DNA/RNA helicase